MAATALALVLACGAPEESPPAVTQETTETSPPTAASDGAVRGVIVHRVRPGLPGDDAGAQEGDLLAAWHATPDGSPPSRGDVRSVTDLISVAQELGPRGAVDLEVIRSGERIRLRFERTELWGLNARPWLSPSLETRVASLAASERDEPRVAAEGYAALARNDLTRRPLAASYYLERAARLLEPQSRQGDPEAADAWRDLFSEARDLVQNDRPTLAQLFDGEGSVLLRRGQLDEARAAHERAAEIRLAHGSRLHAARNLNLQGLIELRRGNVEEAFRLQQRAVAIYDAEAPDSLTAARAWVVLARIHERLGNVDAMEPLLLASLEVRRAQGGGRDVAHGLNPLGVFSILRGDLSRAQQAFAEELSLRREFEPGSSAHANALSNLASIATMRGDLRRADALFEESLDLHEQDWQPLDAAETLTAFASLASRLGDREAAIRRLERARAILAERAPASLRHAKILDGLAREHLREGSPNRAAELLERSIRIRETGSPEASTNAVPLLLLARLHLDRGDVAQSRSHWERAWHYVQRAPGSIAVGSAELLRAEIERVAGRPAQALALAGRAHTHFESLVPQSYWIVEAEHEIARALTHLERRDETLEHYRRALEIFDEQDARLGSVLDRARFAERYADLFEEYLALLMDDGRTTEAFEALEVGRNRQLRNQLAQRDLRRVALPEDLDRERRRLSARYARALEALYTPDQELETAASARDKVATLREIERERGLLDARISQLGGPGPDLPNATKIHSLATDLPSGTLFLSFYVGHHRSWVFGLQPGASEVQGAELEGDELERSVGAFLRLVRAPGPASTLEVLHNIGARLYRQLLGPLDAQVAHAERLVIVPHGVLWQLPFAALRTRGGYLVERVALSVTPSATFTSVLRDRNGDTEARFVGFADSRAPIGSAAPSTPTSRQGEDRGDAPPWIARRADTLGALPRALAEARAARSHYPRGEVFAGHDATETRAREALRTASRVHFAVHGLHDRRLPLDAALVLSPEANTQPTGQALAEDDGLLQAWEILELDRVRAQVVTLSACETAAGEEIGLEAPLGLPRALLVAGAGSVVASTWRVSDHSTELLMSELHRRLAQGAPVDEALRAAQRSLLPGRKSAIAQPATSWRARLFGRRAEPSPRDFGHPYYWAAFRVEGLGDP